MARVTVEDCIDKVESPYELVLVAKERAAQLNSGIEPSLNRDNDKNTVIALREIAEGKVSTNDLRTNAVLKLRKEPDEIVGEEEQEEITNDDFESQYKGEVSKSGVAILPSKRARKTPAQNALPSDNKDKEGFAAMIQMAKEKETFIHAIICIIYLFENTGHKHSQC